MLGQGLGLCSVLQSGTQNINHTIRCFFLHSLNAAFLVLHAGSHTPHQVSAAQVAMAPTVPLLGRQRVFGGSRESAPHLGCLPRSSSWGGRERGRGDAGWWWLCAERVPGHCEGLQQAGGAECWGTPQPRGM